MTKVILVLLVALVLWGQRETRETLVHKVTRAPSVLLALLVNAV